MTVISLEHSIVDRLNRLPPHSRLRPGYVDLMRQIKREQLAEERVHRTLVRALEEEFERDPLFALFAVFSRDPLAELRSAVRGGCSDAL